MSESRAFVRGMAGEAIELEFAKALIKHYRSPPVLRMRAPTKRGKVRQFDLWVLSVHDGYYSEEETGAASASWTRRSDERQQHD